MASEIQYSYNYTCSKSGASVSASGSATVDMTGTNMISNVQDIGTSAELISFIDVTAPFCTCVFKNLDPTNYVELALDAGMTQKVAKIKPLGAAVYAPVSGTLYARANTAAVQLQVVAGEE